MASRILSIKVSIVSGLSAIRDRYQAMLNEFLFTKIEEEEATLDVLRPVFEDRIINSRADVIWPPRSQARTIDVLKDTYL